MQQETIRLTTAQFAKLHNVNKRTLHYYDDIGLFSPCHKGENGYRYYDYSQSIDFEYIRMLKEINLSIEEIKAFIHSFDEQKFLEIVSSKQKEIDREIRKLKTVKSVLKQKKEHLLFCRQISDMRIEISDLKEEYLLTVPYEFEEDNPMKVFAYIQSVWTPEQYRAGVGSYLSLDKIQAGQFDKYDGLYTVITEHRLQNGSMTKPKGAYLCGYLKGSWSRLPELYEKMLSYADEHGLRLTGYSFERELTDYTIASEKEYITQVMICLLYTSDAADE